MTGRDAMPECDHALDAGAYLLSALPEEDHRSFTTHLRTCSECRHEVEHLQVVVDTLPIAAPQLAPPPELKDRIMRIVDAEAELLRAAGPEADRVPTAPAKRTRRWGSGLFLRPAMAGAMASILIAVGVAGGVLVSGDNGPAPTRTLSASVNKDAIGATATVALQSGHAVLHVTKLPAAPSGRVYQVWLKRGKTITPTHTLFGVRNDGSAVVPVEESVKDADQILVTDEPDGGSATPTGTMQIAATLS